MACRIAGRLTDRRTVCHTGELPVFLVLLRFPKCVEPLQRREDPLRFQLLVPHRRCRPAGDETSLLLASQRRSRDVASQQVSGLVSGRRTCIFLAGLLLSGVCAWSQAQAHATPESDGRRYQIYGGPVFNGSNPSGDSMGAGVGFGGNFNRWGGILGEFTMARSSCCVVNNVTLIDFLVGPRVEQPLSRSSRIGVFADFLVGAVGGVRRIDPPGQQHPLAQRNLSGLPVLALQGSARPAR
jgi:hypothetical protein